MSSINRLWLKIKISLLLAPVALGLRLLGLQRMQALLTALPNRHRPIIKRRGDIARQHGQAIRWAKRHALYRGNCLSRSVLLWWLLHRRSIKTQLCIGTRRYNGEFQAHAWVEYQDAALNAGPRVRQKYITFMYAFSDTIDSTLFYGGKS